MKFYKQILLVSVRDLTKFIKVVASNSKTDKILLRPNLTCVAWNCSRKTTFTLVFSSSHLVILDIAGKQN
jgi:hypothetical protein